MKRPLCTVCCVLILCIAVAVRLFPPRIPDGSEYDGEKIILAGRIVKKEQRSAGKRQFTVLYLKSVKNMDFSYQKLSVREADSHKTKNKKLHTEGVICYLGEDRPEYRIGAKIRVKGVFMPFRRARNPGEFDEALYYRIQGYSGKVYEAEGLSVSKKYFPVSDSLQALRCRLENGIDRAYDEKDAGLLKAILLGNKSGVDTELKNLYRQSGIIHILAISGLHISILGLGLYRLLRRLTVPVTVSAGAAFLFLLFYGIMVGNGISVLRAVGMFGIRSLGKAWGRTYDLPTSLSVLGLILLLENPLYLYHSGFWLSFGSVAGIAVIYPVFLKLLPGTRTRPLPGNPVGGFFRKECLKLTQALMASLSVTLMTLPVILWFYYETPVYSLLLNIFVIPSMTVVMILGVINLLLTVFFIPSFRISRVHHLIFEFFEALCLLNRNLPGHILTAGKPGAVQVIIFYLFLAAALWILKNRNGKKAVFLGTFLLTAAVPTLIFRWNPGLTVHMLDTGQGDTGVILYHGKAWIIDAGSSTRKQSGQRILIPFLKYHGIRDVQAAFVTHPDSDHYNGILELMSEAEEENIRVHVLILPEIPNSAVASCPAMKKLEKSAAECRIPVLYFQKGMTLDSGGMRLVCLHPDSADYGENNNLYSQVLLLEYGAFSMAFMGDAEGDAERAAVRIFSGLKRGISPGVTVLKVAHHGSSGATGLEALEILNPEAALISCGENNRYGHPHAETLERIDRCGARIFMTPESGAITVRTDGKRVSVTEFIKENSAE